MNEIQHIQVSTHGAELQSLVANGREYLWQGDPEFWGRRAPILFPIVGRLADDTLRIDGKAYQMKQHGFARDAEFVQNQDRYEMVRDDNRNNYPYSFDLSAKYLVKGDTLSCEWQVKNLGDKDMHFQIGAHPAFNLPDYRIDDNIHGFLQCYDENNNVINPIESTCLVDGLRHRCSERKPLYTEGSYLAITGKTFNDGAILLENNQVASVALFDKLKNKILSVTCPQAEAFGLWAPNKQGCSFVCIEPWCGIADRYDFKGDISEREYNHCLASGNSFLFNFGIRIYN